MDLDRATKTWDAKKFYDGYLANTTPEQQVQYKSMTLEAYKYLGDYYVNSPEKNIEKAKEVWSKVIELDPANEAAYKKIVEKLK
jgi:lipoprotein NlpI